MNETIRVLGVFLLSCTLAAGSLLALCLLADRHYKARLAKEYAGIEASMRPEQVKARAEHHRWQPCVMIATWDKDHTPDVMMAAWAGQLDYTQIVISLGKHKTTDNLAQTGAFTVSFADERTVAESDYFGLVSGNKVPDKVARAGFTVTPSPNVDAPIINEYPLTLECRVVSFEDDMLIGEVVNQSADESILTDGKVDLTKLKPIVFDAAAMCYVPSATALARPGAAARL